MKARAIIARLDSTPCIVVAAAGGIDDADARWRPADGGWSILEIVNHMADEEVEDFRARLRSTLDDPTRVWPAIDPESAAWDRGYNQRDIAESVARFASVRNESLAWLRSLYEPDWSALHQHPTLGPLCAGDLLASWAAHDALHLRQIAKRLFQLSERDAGDYSTRYAGEWTA